MAEGDSDLIPIADLHCHYPMHLPETAGDSEPSPGNPALDAMIQHHPGWLRRLRAWLLRKAALKLNDPSEQSGWRVSYGRIRAGGVRIVCSVLYQPFDEMDLGKWPEGPPESGYAGDIEGELGAVNRHLAEDDQASEHVVVTKRGDLDAAAADGRTAFVHCIEGGFHLGSSENDIKTAVTRLSGAGVAYVTLAHLFFRQVAKNAPALPFLTDRRYAMIFWQWGKPLTWRGEAAVRAMYEKKILIDISHMREDAIAKVFDLVETLDDETGRLAESYPIIATHVGARLNGQAYNLSDDTIRRIAKRKGVIGLILAQHQLLPNVDGPPPADLDASVEILKKHIDHIHGVTGSYEYIGIGSDLDGFIKPTMTGIENIDDLQALAGRLTREYPDAAPAILHDNALRVLRAAFTDRPSD